MKEKKNNRKKYISIGIILFLFPLMLVVFGLLPKHEFYTTPYYSADTIITPEVKDNFNPENFYKIPEFEFTNHLGQPYGSDSLTEDVWIAVFFSTDSPALKDITSQLLGVNYRYRNEETLKIVCFSLNTEHDTPEVLNEYVSQNTPYNINNRKWQFLTGDQEEINTLIRDGFLIDDPQNTAVIWLVDPTRHLRGRYHLNDSKTVKAAQEDMALLSKEIDRKKSELEKSK